MPALKNVRTAQKPASPDPVFPRDVLPEPRQLTVAQHLEELRKRLGISLACLLLAVAASFLYVDGVIGFLQKPAAAFLPHFAFFTPTEPLVAYIRVSVLVGLMVAMPLMLWQVWAFVRLGLTGAERRLGLFLVGWGSLLFMAGAAFAYYFLLPVSFHVLLSIGRSRLQPMVSIDAYLSFVTALMAWCGAIFELPVVLYVLARVGIVTAAWLRQQRPYAVLVMVIAAAILTPTTDPVNLLLMTVPLVLLYEVSILITGFAVPASAQRRSV